MADKDLLTLRYKEEDEGIVVVREVESLQVGFDGFVVAIEVQEDNSVDIVMTYPDGEKLMLESILRDTD